MPKISVTLAKEDWWFILTALDSYKEQWFQRSMDCACDQVIARIKGQCPENAEGQEV